MSHVQPLAILQSKFQNHWHLGSLNKRLRTKANYKHAPKQQATHRRCSHRGYSLLYNSSICMFLIRDE